jgi:error-prone DNA polymerase
MVHPYLRRRCGEEPFDYPDDRIRAVLKKTMGVPIFQEQAMRLAVVAAGFTPGEADQLRRAMGAWRKRGLIEQFRQKLIDGMQRNGYTAEFGERLYQQISGFGEYGFPESHAASFALLVYVSAWIKCHYPDVFVAALINSQPMGFYAPAQLVADARKHGVEVRPVDVNASEWDCTLERSVVRSSWSVAQKSGAKGQGSGVSSQRTTDNGQRTALRLGFRVIRGLAKAHAETIVACRNEGGPFTSFDEFARRTGLSSAVLSKLSRADAFGSLQMNRRHSLWNSLPMRKQLPLFDDVPSGHSTPASGERLTESTIANRKSQIENIPPMSPLSEVVADYQHTGLSLKDHPVKFLRPMLRQMNVVYARELAYLPVDRRVKVAGLVLLRQRPGTASGITFVTLEDETGFANLIIHPGTWERFHHAARTASVLLARGILQREKQVIHVLVDKLEDLSAYLKDAKLRSRDFH